MRSACTRSPEMQDGLGQTREALTLYRSALDIHRTLADADPGIEDTNLEPLERASRQLETLASGPAR